ncbi:ACT domain-containing protein [Christensenella hongkongensis]
MQDIISGMKIVSSIYAEDENDAIITLIGVPHEPQHIADIFDALAKNSVNLDTISQAYPQDGKVDIVFSISSSDIEIAKSVLSEFDGLRYDCVTDITKLTIEGEGMQRQFGVVARLFSALAADHIKTYIMTNSQTRISFCIGSKNTTKAITAVTQAFGL